MDNWAIAILPLVGVVLGAGLQFWFSRAAERKKHADLQRELELLSQVGRLDCMILNAKL